MTMTTKKTMTLTMTEWGWKPPWAQSRKSNGKIGHRSAKCPHKKQKERLEKAGTAADANVKKTKSKCSYCGKPGKKEEDCWKKHPHKAPSRSSTEATGRSWMKNCLCATLNKTRCPTSRKT
jgi:hypothetical protein